jgi:hypothetical protein
MLNLRLLVPVILLASALFANSGHASNACLADAEKGKKCQECIDAQFEDLDFRMRLMGVKIEKPSELPSLEDCQVGGSVWSPFVAQELAKITEACRTTEGCPGDKTGCAKEAIPDFANRFARLMTMKCMSNPGKQQKYEQQRQSAEKMVATYQANLAKAQAAAGAGGAPAQVQRTGSSGKLNRSTSSTKLAAVKRSPSKEAIGGKGK